MSGHGFLLLDASGVPRGRRTDWLADQLRDAIDRGALPPGTPLPATRTLAAELGLARNTVTEVYRRLAEEALVTARVGAGTVVAAAPPRPPAPARTTAPARGPATLPSTEPSTGPSTEPVDLATGVPDLGAFPRAAWLRAERVVLDGASRADLSYPPVAGAPALRTALSAWLARSRGVHAAPDDVIVTAGVTGALSLLAPVLLDEGHTTIGVEDPGAQGNRRILDYWLPAVTHVAVDDDGLDVADLRRQATDAVVVTPAHHYPTGVVLSPERRRALVAWAQEGERRLVVEDDYDAEYRYDRRPVRALQPLAPDHVVYVASLSKTLAPALRLGWLIPPRRLHDRLVERRWATDLGSPAVPQLVLAELLRSGALERHLRTMRGRHRTRRDAAVSAIHEHLPGLRVTGIAAGLHVVVLLPEHLDDEQVAARARDAGVLVQPLSVHRGRPGPPGLVLSYAAHPPARFAAAVAVLATVVGPARGRSGTAPAPRRPAPGRAPRAGSAAR